MEKQRERLLAAHLRACGHFLYYQTGGKAGQRRILVTLLMRGCLTQKELQDVLEVSSGALSEILQKMEDSAFIERKKSEDDRRQIMLELTPEGHSLALRTKEHTDRTLARMFECLSVDEQQTLNSILAKLTAHLDTLKTDPMFEAGVGPCG